MMFRRPLVLILGIAIASGGCAVRASQLAVAPAAPATATPSGWQATASGTTSSTPANLTTWWTQLGDRTLSGLIEQALANSPDVRSAQARLRQARAQRSVTAAVLKPSVTAGASASGGYDRPTSLSPGFDASWEPDVFGGGRASAQAATADVNATIDDLHATQVSLSAEVARNYIELRTTQSRLAIARRNEAAQAETLQLTDFRAQAGLVGSVDVEQARTNLEQTRAQLPTLESAIAQQMHRLAVLAGLTPESLTSTLSTGAPLPSLPASIAVGIPAETLRQRPDVHAAEQRIVAETARLTSADAKRYPRFTLSGSIGAEIVTGALTGGTSLAASAAASVVQTLFDGGRIRQQIAVQSAVQEQRVAAYESTMLTALEDVENALVNYENSRLRLESLRAAETAAGNAALLAQTQYSAGVADFQRVLDTQRTFLSVQDSVASTEGDRLTAFIQLFKALGGGWSTTADAGAVSRSQGQ